MSVSGATGADSPHTVELCLMIEGQEGVTWPQWQAIARACESSGIGTLFRSDHYLNLDGQHPERGSLDAWGTLIALAAQTTTLRLGTMVSPATFRHPSELAKLVTTADHVSNGRVELGLGAGWHEREHAAYGFPYHDTRTRMDILEEQLAIVHGTWTAAAPDGEPFSHDGTHYTLRALDAQPRPVQRPHPPLIMGGNAGPRAARLAATYADEYNTVYATPEQVAQRKAVIDAACMQAGRDEIPFSVMTAVIVGRDEAELRTTAEHVAKRGERPAEELLREPPPGWIIGTFDQAAEQIRDLQQAGVSRIMCQHLAHDDTDFIAALGEGLQPLVA